MRRTMLIAYMCLLFVLGFSCANHADNSPGVTQEGAELIAQIEEPNFIPEGIAYDEETKSLFVGGTYKRKIVRIDESGAVSDFAPAREGFFAPLGLRVDPARGLLWALHVSSHDAVPMMGGGDAPSGWSGIVGFDLKTGAVKFDHQILIDGDAHFLNDLDIADDGTLFISDTVSRAIYRFAPEVGRFDLVARLPEGEHPNGVTLSDDEKFLFVARAGVPGAYRIDTETGDVRAIELGEGIPIRADGLYFRDGNLIAVQPWIDACHVCQFTLNTEMTRVEEVVPLATSNDPFLQPSTGVIVNDHIYVVANSQAQHFRSLFVDTNGNVSPDDVEAIKILRVALEEE